MGRLKIGESSTSFDVLIWYHGQWISWYTLYQEARRPRGKASAKRLAKYLQKRGYDVEVVKQKTTIKKVWHY